MKKLILSLVATVMLVFTMSIPANAQQKLNAEQRKMVVAEMQKQIPAQVSPGMTWSAISLNSTSTVLNLTFKINATEMGTTNAEFREELSQIDPTEFKSLLGEEFAGMLVMFGCDAKITFLFTDSTPSFSQVIKN